jgi:hypothetical protein
MRDAALLLEISEDLKQRSPRRHPLRWEWADREDGGGIIVPSEPSQYLFRGQNVRYRPCLPCISRDFEFCGSTVQDLRPRDKIVLIRRLAQGAWFEDTLDLHPAVKWANEKKIYIDRLALAQHYGVPTGYIDLTESFDVAAFFATCRFDRATMKWAACSSGDGVIYRVHWVEMPTEPKRVRWIGLQPLPRPAEQWAWTCELLLGEDFERAPGLQAISFSHSVKVGEIFLSQFDGGRSLFPSDPMANVATRITVAAELPADALNWAIGELLSEGMIEGSRERVLSELADVGISPREKVESPLTREDAHELETIWDSRKEEFFRVMGGVGMRLVRTLRSNE